MQGAGRGSRQGDVGDPAEVLLVEDRKGEGRRPLEGAVGPRAILEGGRRLRQGQRQWPLPPPGGAGNGVRTDALGVQNPQLETSSDEST